MSHEVRIHIDQHRYSSPTPTTGDHLYELAHVPEGLVLFKEVAGDREDTLIRIDAAHVHLTEDEHFHSGPAPEHHHLVYVNTEPFVVEKDTLSFDEITKKAFPSPPTGLDPEFTVSFEHAASTPHHGDLVEGGSVKLKKHGTMFDVAHTNRS